ncbi:MAG: hypothetical protein RMK01_10490 [Thermomicrobium sp.]|nr:hypothetical protein [Thermomicrobium sp.]
MEVELAGVPLVVLPGSYRRESLAARPTATTRVGVRSFARAGQALQRAGDRYWASLGAWPVWEGHGLRAGPALRPVAAPANWPVASPVWSGALAPEVHVVAGSRQWRLAGTAGSASAGLVEVRQLAAAVVDACQMGTRLLFAHGGAAQVSSADLAAGTYTTAYYQTTARLIATDGQAGYVVPTTAGQDDRLLRYTAATSSTTLQLDAPVRRVTSHAGFVWALTRTALWRVKGTTAELLFTVSPLLSDDDGAFLVGHGTALYTWLGGQVHRADTTGTVRGWTPTGPRGLATRGAASAGGFLWAVVQDAASGRWQLWATPGRLATLQGLALDWERAEPWFLVEEWSDAGAGWPVAVGGRHPDTDLLLNRAGTSGVLLAQAMPRPGFPGLRSDFAVTSGLATGLPAASVPWLGVGAALAWLGEGGAGAVQARLGWSADAGTSWSWGTWRSVGGGAASGFAVLEERFATPLAAASLQARVAVSGVSDWSPAVVGLWALAGAAVEATGTAGGAESVWRPRRRWRLSVQVEPLLPRDSGAADTRDAAGLVASLWDAWRSGTVVWFRDIDAAAGATVPVQVAELVERVEGPEVRAGRRVDLVLVEVA